MQEVIIAYQFKGQMFNKIKCTGCVYVGTEDKKCI